MSVFLLVVAAGDRHRKPRSHSLDSRRLRLQCGMHMSTQRNDLYCLYIIYIISGAYEPPKAARSVQLRIIAQNGICIYSST